MLLRLPGAGRALLASLSRSLASSSKHPPMSSPPPPPPPPHPPSPPSTQPSQPPSQQKAKPKSKLRGLPKDAPEVRLSKTLSWLLRHGAQSEKLPMRADGFVRVKDLLATPKLAAQLDWPALQRIVAADTKQRYTLLSEPPSAAASSAASSSDADADAIWWIKANQGHSIKAVQLVLKPITSPADVPMAVHGTTRKAWQSISRQGLSKMSRNHIHLAQGIPGDGIISGMRASAQVLIHIDLPKALAAGIPFALSDNGVVLSAGDARGFLPPAFFGRVVDREGRPVLGWTPPQPSTTPEVGAGAGAAVDAGAAGDAAEAEAEAEAATG